MGTRERAEDSRRCEGCVVKEKKDKLWIILLHTAAKKLASFKSDVIWSDVFNHISDQRGVCWIKGITWMWRWGGLIKQSSHNTNSKPRLPNKTVALCFTMLHLQMEWIQSNHIWAPGSATSASISVWSPELSSMRRVPDAVTIICGQHRRPLAAKQACTSNLRRSQNGSFKNFYNARGVLLPNQLAN